MAYTKADVKAAAFDMINENLRDWIFDSQETMRDGVLFIDGVVTATKGIVDFLEDKG